MKKVLFLLAAFDKGGIEKVTLDIVNNLDPKKYDITIYTVWYGGFCQSQVKPYVKVKPFFFKRYVKGIVRLINYLPPKLLYKTFIRGKYDIEIAAGDGECSKIISGSSNRESRKISWIHMDVVEKGSNLKEFKSKSKSKKIYEKFDDIICVSKEAELQFNKRFGFNNKTCTVHNPLIVEEIIRKSQEPAETTFDDNCFNMITIGRLTAVKGYDRLIRCCEKLEKEDNLNFHLYIVGDGEQKQELKEYIETNNIRTVTLLGFKDNPYKYLKCADLFVCSSYSEAYPLVIGESFVLGIPVIATRCGGSVEWLECDKSGYLVQNSDIALYEGLRKVLQDCVFYRDMKEKANYKKENIKNGIEEWEEAFLLGMY